MRDFWDWFKINSDKFLKIEMADDLLAKEELMNTLMQKLHAYCSHLYFELASENGQYGELIITAKGNEDYFGKADKLVEAAPYMENWEIISLIPPRGISIELDYEGLKLYPKKLWFLPLENPKIPEAIGLQVGIENYEELKGNRWLMTAIHEILDNIVGERFSAKIIQHVRIGALPTNPEVEGYIELEELLEYINWKKKR